MDCAMHFNGLLVFIAYLSILKMTTVSTGNLTTTKEPVVETHQNNTTTDENLSSNEIANVTSLKPHKATQSPSSTISTRSSIAQSTSAKISRSSTVSTSSRPRSTHFSVTSISSSITTHSNIPTSLKSTTVSPSNSTVPMVDTGVHIFTVLAYGCSIGLGAVLLISVLVLACFARKKNKSQGNRTIGNTDIAGVRRRNPILDLDRIAKQRSAVINESTSSTSMACIPPSPQPWDYDSPVRALVSSSDRSSSLPRRNHHNSSHSSTNTNRYVNPIYQLDCSDEEDNAVCVAHDGTIYLRLGSLTSEPKIVLGDSSGDYAEIDFTRPGPSLPLTEPWHIGSIKES
ncbi:uncharacterized protein LOC141900605 isoform X2 [Tubulanus polymorphus]|uniref:uncharacterized protein LOC141900605 isoform X2 n=1 Tax=Tubulanus polymorphus TaxID=672921 RepID=UPI003DA50132